MGRLLRPHEYGLCTHYIAKLSALGLLLNDGGGPHFFQTNPPSEISSYVPDYAGTDLCPLVSNNMLT